MLNQWRASCSTPSVTDAGTPVDTYMAHIRHSVLCHKVAQRHAPFLLLTVVDDVEEPDIPARCMQVLRCTTVTFSVLHHELRHSGIWVYSCHKTVRGPQRNDCVRSQTIGQARTRLSSTSADMSMTGRVLNVRMHKLRTNGDLPSSCVAQICIGIAALMEI